MTFDLALLALGLGGCVALCRPLLRRGEGLALIVFLASYTGLFFLGALGMHFDSEGYFSDWIASIAVREVYLTTEQRHLHLACILSPYLLVPAGCHLASYAQRLFGATGRWATRSPAWVWLWAYGPIVLAYPFGSFWFSAALLWAFMLTATLADPRAALPTWSRAFGYGHLVAILWGLCAFVLLQHSALGSFYAFFSTFGDQTSLLTQRADLTTGLPVWYWSVAYTLLPMACAAYVLQTPAPSLRRRSLAVVSCAWILFAHFFKGQLFFFLLFLVFCAGAKHPRLLLRGVGITALTAAVALSAFYIAASGLSGDPQQTWLLFTHFFYRLGTNQHFYLAFFPDMHPFLGADLSHFPNLDAQLVYGFMYPGDVLNEAGSTAGPYISNAWAQGGLGYVLAYGLAAGILLQGFWRAARAFTGLVGQIFQGRVLFVAFLLAQLSFRDLLFSGWGLLWCCFGLILLRAAAPPSAPFSREGVPAAP